MVIARQLLCDPECSCRFPETWAAFEQDALARAYQLNDIVQSDIPALPSPVKYFSSNGTW